jgi:hypothetical protein
MSEIFLLQIHSITVPVTAGTPIPIHGNCTLLYDPGPAEDVLVKILIKNEQGGSTRTYNIYTQIGTGKFAITFQPSYNEGGNKLILKIDT